MNYATALSKIQDRNYRTLVTVTTSFVGFHQWPAAPAEVAFLRDLHRHVFGVRVTVSVTHSDRDVEFFMLQNYVNDIIENVLKVELSSDPRMSCEMMATILSAHLFGNKYSVVSVAVDEDGENEGMLVFNP